jgi:type IX secretion system PorP/SprF family membrane protein
MKYLKYLYAIFFCFLLLLPARGQDIHYSQFQMAPLTFNPALTGAFLGSFRIGGLYRDQWANFLSNQFVTPSVYIDSPILRGFREQDWVGAGLMVFQDQAGAGKLSFGGLLGSVSYHLGLDKNQRTVLSAGFQMGTLSRKIKEKENFRFEDAILSGQQVSEDLTLISEDNTSYMDMAAGLVLTGRTIGTSYYQIGISALHLTTPDNGLLGSSSSTIPMKFVAHGKYDWDYNESFRIVPAFFVQNLEKSTEVQIQAKAGYKMSSGDVVVYGGLGYRFGDAMEILASLDYKSLKAGISYDLTLSDLSPTGGFEIAVAYIGKIYKRPKVTPAIFCPRF